MSVFEMLMILCFGIAWPFSIYRSYKSKTIKGKSFFFLLIILLGYISGTVHKIVYNFDYVIILYISNLIMVSIDLILYLIYKKNLIKTS